MTQDKTRAKTKDKGKPTHRTHTRTKSASQEMSVDALLETFCKWLEAHDRSAHSIRAYLSDVKQFVEWFVEHTKQPFVLDAITNDDVRAWRDDLEATHQPASINRKLTALSAFYRWASETGRVEHDPTAHVNGVEQQPIAPKALAKNDLNRILREARKGGQRDEAMLELLAATGLRVSELAKLRIGDLDLGERHGWVTVSGKGRKQRRVPVHAKARQVLREYLAKRGQVGPGDPLFETQKESVAEFRFSNLKKAPGCAMIIGANQNHVTTGGSECLLLYPILCYPLWPPICRS